MNGHSNVPIKLYLQKQVAGQIWLMHCSWQPLIQPSPGVGRLVSIRCPAPPALLSWMNTVREGPSLSWNWDLMVSVDLKPCDVSRGCSKMCIVLMVGFTESCRDRCDGHVNVVAWPHLGHHDHTGCVSRRTTRLMVNWKPGHNYPEEDQGKHDGTIWGTLSNGGWPPMQSLVVINASVGRRTFHCFALFAQWLWPCPLNSKITSAFSVKGDLLWHPPPRSVKSKASWWNGRALWRTNFSTDIWAIRVYSPARFLIHQKIFLTPSFFKKIFIYFIWLRQAGLSCGTRDL